ncbi:hypothetical protein BDN72DRAFT_905428 [Pluteus cervinus]|uniref:Uncharacterized protein n=1 Tax=Pluteus cervinus TaxID=181527 RepID=A0ACD3A268_9AGAR|nr:hypothetical protein BDN72DRAFT_905428 [Pluteus cervinus]
MSSSATTPTTQIGTQTTTTSHLDNRTFAEVVAGTQPSVTLEPGGMIPAGPTTLGGGILPGPAAMPGPSSIPSGPAITPSPPPKCGRKRRVMSEPEVIEISSDGSDNALLAKPKSNIKVILRPAARKRTRTKKAASDDLVVEQSLDPTLDLSNPPFLDSPTPVTTKEKPRPRPRRRGTTVVKPVLTPMEIIPAESPSPNPVPVNSPVDLASIPLPAYSPVDPASIPLPTTPPAIPAHHSVSDSQPVVITSNAPVVLASSSAPPIPVPPNLPPILTSTPPLVPPVIGPLPTHDLEPCDIVAYPWFPNGYATDYLISYSSFAFQIPVEDAECIHRGIHFVREGPHVNVATIAPTQLVKSGHAIYLRDRPTDLAVALTFGSVTGCHLIGTGTMPGNYPAPVRYITIFPLEELLSQTTALWGHILGLNPVTGPVIGGEGILFQTKRLPKSRLTTTGSSPGSSSTSPSNSSIAPPASSRSRFARAGRTNASYPFVRPFDEPVPIYDGRASTGNPFAFTAEDFQGLSTRTRVTEDLPLDSIVAVGYTMGVWSLNGAELLSLNVQFVILLA